MIRVSSLDQNELGVKKKHETLMKPEGERGVKKQLLKTKAARRMYCMLSLQEVMCSERVPRW